MKCNTCGKEIPASSLVCPFCYSSIEHNDEVKEDTSLTSFTTTYQDNNELNFGNLNNTNYDEEHNTLQTYFKEPKKRKKLLLPIIAVLCGFVGLFIVLALMKPPTIESYKYYTGVVDQVYDYLSENFTSGNAKNSGTYKLVYSINDETKEFKGKYQYDLSKKLVDITGDLKNPEEEKGGIVVNDQTLTLEFFLKNNELYFMSENIFGENILLPYEDETGLLVTKQYDLDVLLEGIKDAINTSLKYMVYTDEKKVNVDLRGSSKEVNKKSLFLNYKAKQQFITVFYDTLIDDSNFIYEYGKISGKKAEEVEKLLNNYKTTYEYKYSTDDGKSSYINIYYKNKDIYRIELDLLNENNTKVLIDLDNNKININEYTEGRITRSLNISRIDSTMNDILTRNYMFEFKKDDLAVNINIELVKDNNPVVKSKDIETSKSIRIMSEEEINTIKTNFGVYMEDTSWIDKVREIFGTKCSPNLSCNCEGETCSCSSETGIITCPASVINSTVE
jgi:hypothetical protein